MAIAHPSFLTEGLRGRVGGLVFSQTRYGLVMRVYTHPRNPRTQAQQAARLRMAASVAAWRGLDIAQKSLWAQYAETQVVIHINAGTARRPTAYAAFVSYAIKFQKEHPDAPIPPDPPVG